MYYRIICEQNNVYMGWGYNATSMEELAADYLDYKSIDWESDETEKYYRSLPLEDVINLIKEDEFSIEESETKFDESFFYTTPFN